MGWWLLMLLERVSKISQVPPPSETSESLFPEPLLHILPGSRDMVLQNGMRKMKKSKMAAPNHNVGRCRKKLWRPKNGEAIRCIHPKQPRLASDCWANLTVELSWARRWSPPEKFWRWSIIDWMKVQSRHFWRQFSKPRSGSPNLNFEIYGIGASGVQIWVCGRAAWAWITSTEIGCVVFLWSILRMTQANGDIYQGECSLQKIENYLFLSAVQREFRIFRDIWETWPSGYK